MPKSFGEFLKQRLEERKMSIRTLEKASGVSNSYISQIISGSRNVPKPAIIKKLAAPLNMPYEELMKAAGYLNEEMNINNFPENLKLVRGEMDIIAFVEDLKERTGNPLVTVEFIEALENSTLNPTDITIDTLSRYANVGNDFWFSKNTIECLEVEKQNYKASTKEDCNTHHSIALPASFTTDFIEWMKQEDAFEYLSLAKKLYDRDINCSIVEALMFKDKKGLNK